MNILQVQDRLKDLSDQQLMREMQSPTGGAPQYLVLTELQRRKKMRDASQQQQAPQSSMAEEAVAGIASLAPPEEPAPQEEMPPQGMYGGGVVRMQEGGNVLRRPLSEMSPEELRELRRQFDFGSFFTRMPNLPAARSVGRPQYTLEELEAEDFRRQSLTRPNEPSRFVEDPESAFANRSPEQMNVRATSPAAPTAPTPSAPPPIFVPDAEARPDSLVPQGQQISPAPIGTNPPTARPTGTATASGTAAAGGASAAAAGIGSLPQSRGYAEILDEIERRGSGSRLDDLAAQLQRTDPEARRSEATNMALIEAGLRVAGSQSPHFATAVAEAAPALQGYSRALGDIRKDQRDDILTQIQMERARAEDARSARALAANLYGTETQRDLAVMRERGDAGRHAARMASDQEYRTQSLVPQDIRTFRSMAGADYDDNNPRHREIMSQIQTRGSSDRTPEAGRLFEYTFGRRPDPNNPEDMRRLQGYLDRGAGERATDQRIQTAMSNDPELRQLIEARGMLLSSSRPEAQRQVTALDERIRAARERIRQEYGVSAGGNGTSDPLGIR